MNFDFDTPVSRRHTDSLKWDLRPDQKLRPGQELLPMWVADMDFRTAPPVAEALRRRAESGVFGYSIVPEEYDDAVIGWWRSRHGFEMKKEWISFCTGVVPALSCAAQVFAGGGDRVIVQTPIYNCFYSSIVNNGGVVLENPLLPSGDHYDMDFDDLDRKLSQPDVKLMFLCNPHNPGGRVWSAEELARVGRLCAAHGVPIIADEIHCDLVFPGARYTPFASVDETCRMNSITCVSPSKTFNLAGLQTANVVIPNPELRGRMLRGMNAREIAEPNAFGAGALIAAYTRGAEWLDALLGYLSGNIRFASQFLAHHLPQLTLYRPEATYLLWIDCAGLGISSKALCERLLRETGLWITDGRTYGENGEGFVRINIACPRDRLADGLGRLKTVADGIEAEKRQS